MPFPFCHSFLFTFQSSTPDCVTLWRVLTYSFHLGTPSTQHKAWLKQASNEQLWMKEGVVEWPEAWASSPTPGQAALLAHPGELLNKCWWQPLLSALEILVFQLKTASKVHVILIKSSSHFSAVEMKVNGAAITPAGFLIKDLRGRSGEMTCTGELFEGPDPAASLKCFLSCLLKEPCEFQRQVYCKVN